MTRAVGTVPLIYTRLIVVERFFSRFKNHRATYFQLFALHQLIENPQNNLRLFVDGKFAYGMETSELPIKSMPSTLEQICSKYGASISYQKLLSMLCQSLGSVNLNESKFCQVCFFLISCSALSLIGSSLSSLCSNSV